MRIGITQRVDKVIRFLEVRDSLDHQWISFLECIDLQVVLIPNQIRNAGSYYRDLNLQGLILSGGNDPVILEDASNVSLERDRTEAALISVARELGHPIVGVCRGMQFLSIQMGEQLKRIEGHVAKRHQLICEPDFPYPDQTEVNSYHNWALVELQEHTPFLVQARTADYSIEAIKHKQEPICGIMWHPEREPIFSEYDLNFFKKTFKHD